MSEICQQRTLRQWLFDTLLLQTTLLAVVALPAFGHAFDDVDREVSEALSRFPHIKLISIKNRSGQVIVNKSDGLTSSDLVNVPLDDQPPRLKRRLQYSVNEKNTARGIQEPYVAIGIQPFRLQYFNCEFNYGGRHNYPMQDYASTHGFNIIYPYRRSAAQKSVFPTGTRLSEWKGISKFRKKWFKDQDIPYGRYDQLDMSHFRIDDPTLRGKKPNGVDFMMVDMEHQPPLSSERLRKTKWYPKQNSSDFERRYYTNYARSLVSTLQAHRRQGFQHLGIYGWSPGQQLWTPMLQNKPMPREAWDVYGKSIYRFVDVIHNSVYCPYFSPKNVAFVLANIEENLRRVNEMPVAKPVRPYFWPLISGGGGGDRWWREVPHLNEDQEAMTAMSFFLGIDGLVIWNWSGQTNHHIPSFSTFASNGKPKRALMVSKAFRMKPDNGDSVTFQRYDLLHVKDYKNGVVSFQKIVPDQKDQKYGILPNRPVFMANYEILKQYLRPRSEPISAVVKGLALIKPFEYMLKTGQPIIDFDSRRDLRQTRPLCRRVKNGSFHLVITYDPMTIRSGEERKIVLKNFAGKKGLHLEFPADQHPRIFVLANPT